MFGKHVLGTATFCVVGHMCLPTATGSQRVTGTSFSRSSHYIAQELGSVSSFLPVWSPKSPHFRFKSLHFCYVVLQHPLSPSPRAELAPSWLLAETGGFVPFLLCVEDLFPTCTKSKRSHDTAQPCFSRRCHLQFFLSFGSQVPRSFLQVFQFCFCFKSPSSVWLKIMSEDICIALKNPYVVYHNIEEVREQRINFQEKQNILTISRETQASTRQGISLYILLSTATRYRLKEKMVLYQNKQTNK